MTELTGASPDPPEAGKGFSITVTQGTPPFTFTWMLGDDDPVEVEPEGHVLDLDIPADAAGKELTVVVRDARGDGDGWSRGVIAPGQPE